MPVVAVQHAIQVLSTFSAGEPLLGVNEIARRVGVHKSTVSRLLATLEDARLVERDEPTGRYRLGPGVVALAGPMLASLNVRDVARPCLEQLALASRESVNLSVWNRVEAVNVEQVPGPTVIKHLAPLGRKNPAHASAVGKVLLAHAPPEHLRETLERGLPRFTERTITDRACLLVELEQVRRQGYATNLEELEPELVAVAAPVRDYRGQVIAAVSVSAPSYRVPPKRVEQLAGLVQQTAAEISQRLGAPVSGPAAPVKS